MPPESVPCARVRKGHTNNKKDPIFALFAYHILSLKVSLQHCCLMVTRYGVK